MLDQFSFSSAVIRPILMRFDYPLNYILLRFTGSIVN